MRFSRTGSASKVARSFSFASLPGAWFVRQGPRFFDKAPEALAELVASQMNLEFRELRQLSQALHYCGGAGIASAGGKQSPPLPAESAVEGVGMDIGRNPSLQTSAWGWASLRTGIQGFDRLNLVCVARPISSLNRPRGPGRARCLPA